MRLNSHERSLATHKEEGSEADDHDHETDVANLIVTQARDFRHHLTVFLWRDKRQHALDNEHKGNRRKYLRSYRWPSELFR